MYLVQVSSKYKNEILKFKEEFIRYDESSIPGSELLDKIDDIDEWFVYVEKNSHIETVSSDWVLTDTYLAIVDEDIVGMISLRHELNDFLENFGHIGYSVRPSCRHNGYATVMLDKVLKIAKNYSMEKIQISAEHDNKASIKVIEKNNGIFDRSYVYLDKQVDIYYVIL